MSDINNWFTVPASNSAPSPDGWPEAMPRSGVNDSGRETQASIKRWYDTPGFRRPFEDFSLNRISDSQFTLVDGQIESEAIRMLGVGQLIRMTQGSDVFVGFVSNEPSPPSYSGSTTTFYVDWHDPDEGGPSSQPDSIEVHDRELGTAAFSDVGPEEGQIPRSSDLADSAYVDQQDLDVGLLGGLTASEISESASRGRINFNGAMNVWQRGIRFDSGSQPNNDNGNLSADGWVIVSDGDNRVDVERSDDAPPGFRHSMVLESRSTRKYGVLHCIEPDDIPDQAGGSDGLGVSLSFWAKFDAGATGVNQARVYLLTQRRDGPGNPVVTWPPGSGLDVALNSADWSAVGSQTVNLTAGWQDFRPSLLQGVEIDPLLIGNGGAAIFIHVDEGDISPGSRWFLSGVQLSVGEQSVPFQHRPISEELIRAYRHCVSMAGDGTPLGDGMDREDGLSVVPSNGLILADFRFPVEMYDSPTFVPYGIEGGEPGEWHNGSNSVAATGVLTNRRHAEIGGDGATNGTIYTIGGYFHANVFGGS